MSLKPKDGNWQRLVERLADQLAQGVNIAHSYMADYPDAHVKQFCNDFIIQATAALEDD